VDCRSRLEALTCFNGKPPALRGLPFISKEFLAESGPSVRIISSLERILPSSSRYEGFPVLLNMFPDLTR
jgi:hypothetical protein